MSPYLLLIINPGSTSTKVAVYRDQTPVFTEELAHSEADLASFAKCSDQFSFRKQAILETLRQRGFSLNDLHVVMARGGLIRPVESGVYEVNEAMRRDLQDLSLGDHASNLGGLIAADLVVEYPHLRAFIVDPVVVDELDDVARLSGHPLFPRRSIFHALNHKAVARHYAQEQGRSYESLNLIVAHMGGGVSVAAHRQGRVVDVNNALSGEGPFSSERVGTLAAGDLLAVCLSEKYTSAELKKMLKGDGGLKAHLGTNQMLEALEREDRGDAHARLVIDAFCYNIAKYIGEMAVVLRGRVDAILMTGGIARSERICRTIHEQAAFIGPLVRYPGEDEMGALALNGLRVLRDEVTPKIYGS